MKKKLLTAFCFFLITTFSFAQKKVTVEDIRCASAVGPVMDYWRLTDIREAFGACLNKLTQQYFGYAVTDTLSLPIEMVETNANDEKLPVHFSGNDNSTAHLYLKIYEYAPVVYFAYAKQKGRLPDSAVIKQTKTVFYLNAVMVNGDKQVLLDKSLEVMIAGRETTGIGIEAVGVAVTSKGFIETLKAAMRILIDPSNREEAIQVQAVPAFMQDNFIMPNVLQQPRIFVKSAKDAATFYYRDATEIIRLGTPFYQDIKWHGKKKDKLAEEILTDIKNADNAVNSDFVFVTRECRDVLRNKDYTVKLLMQADPDAPSPARFVNFLANRQYLLHDKDTAAVFSIRKNIRQPNANIFATQVWNGYDTSANFTFSPDKYMTQALYSYVLQGKIHGHTFSILCSGGNSVKEIWMDERLICIVQGKLIPDHFVVFDASLSGELLNQLFMIGFTRFFE